MFLVYCPALDRVYLVPVDEAPRTRMYLRTDATRNSQTQRVNWAADYELPG